ncbi:hypothetical protein RRG08_045563 [Elysia crispata]|uniref:Uncharacterized protein n=1 Tax=Elysia crispata TaxID=231223 RepID=A0AAE1AER3_9GAST|nr:hypothetical protein RRG08_045563 [Elysia crispata]
MCSIFEDLGSPHFNQSWTRTLACKSSSSNKVGADFAITAGIVVLSSIPCTISLDPIEKHVIVSSVFLSGVERRARKLVDQNQRGRASYQQLLLRQQNRVPQVGKALR